MSRLSSGRADSVSYAIDPSATINLDSYVALAPHQWRNTLDSTAVISTMGLSKPTLGRGTILSYGIGHILNDLTAACWFTYLLIFLTDVGLTPG